MEMNGLLMPNIDQTEEIFQGEVIDDEKIIDEIKQKRNQKSEKVSDVITMQCIVCIILAIAFVVINIVLPKLSEDIVQKYRTVSVSDDKVNDALVSIVSTISDFMNTAPNDRI